ncbi:MAG: DUF1043 family protein [Saccharospirillum sp.]|uniref:YhcB family protein n=1 Tax=Saccharospirillum sp. TaxID=2033801 RepID=UPI0032983790
MENTMLQLDWITFIVIIVIALLAGAVLSRLWGKAQGEDPNGLKRQLEDLKRQHQNYQINVTEHFSRTTELIDNLNQSYASIRDHLNQGADQLVAPEYRLESARAGGEDLQDLAPQPAASSSDFDMPRDYATKTPKDIGMLSESFGFTRVEEADAAAGKTPADTKAETASKKSR